LRMGKLTAVPQLPAPPGMHFIPLNKDPMLAVLPQDHPLALKKNIRVEELLEEPFIVPDKRNDADIRQLLSQFNMHPKVKYILNNELSIAAMVENGHGVTILPSMILKGHSYNVCLRPLSPPCYRELGITSRQLCYVSPATRRFIECVVDKITCLSRDNELE